MKKNKVCILAAGRGTRLGDYTQVLNKAMLPLGGKAIISHIFSNFSPQHEFVVALGYKGEALKNYIELAHPDLNVTFVNVENFDGAGSGPGTSLLSCKEALGTDPFYFVTCDTYWTTHVSEFPSDKSWVGVSMIEKSKTHHYCLIDTDSSGAVTDLRLKTASEEPMKEVFTGLAFVIDTEIFWNALSAAKLHLGEKQVTEAFQELARQKKLFSVNSDWVDLGLIENYRNELKKYGQYDFSKVKEAFYSINSKVIKYFDNDQDSSQRVARAKMNPEVFPEVIGHRKNMYSYGYCPGSTLYDDDRPEVFAKLLNWLDTHLWIPVKIEKSEVAKICDIFYREKTIGRINQFKLKYPGYEITKINDEKIPSIDELLKNMDWQIFQDGVPCFIHGDLQPDNIIYDTASDRFVLLDWRQNFGGQIAFGDLYYDFAKLWGGLHLSYKEIKKNEFNYKEEADSCYYQYSKHPHFDELSQRLEAFAKRKDLSVGKIRLLVGIIYLNMSPLHHYPFDKMLFALGRKVLYEAQKNIS